MWTRGGNEVPVFPVELLALNSVFLSPSCFVGFMYPVVFCSGNNLKILWSIISLYFIDMMNYKTFWITHNSPMFIYSSTTFISANCSVAVGIQSVFKMNTFIRA